MNIGKVGIRLPIELLVLGTIYPNIGQSNIGIYIKTLCPLHKIIDIGIYKVVTEMVCCLRLEFFV